MFHTFARLNTPAILCKVTTFGALADAVATQHGDGPTEFAPMERFRYLDMNDPLDYKGYFVYFEGSPLRACDLIEFPRRDTGAGMTFVFDIPDFGPYFVWREGDTYVGAAPTEESYANAVENRACLTFLDILK